MTQIYLVRHAEAEGNLYRRIHGWYDALITDNGYAQIEALERRFADIHIDAVYSSDLFRTKTTAAAVWRPKGLRPVTSKRLREVSMGAWEDRTWGDVARTDSVLLNKFNRTDPTWQVEGGESFQMLRDRMETAIRSIAALHPGQTVAVFSHGSAIRNALAVFHGMSIEESAALGHSDNTAVSLLEFDGDKVHVVFEDDNSHLSDEISTLARQNWWKEKGEHLERRNLWFRPLDIQGGEAEYFLQAQRETRLRLYGASERSEEEALLKRAQERAKEHPECTLCAMLEDQRMGILHMDLDRDADKGTGHISFCYINEGYRRRGFGVQLLGQAVATYRPLGRNYLRLHCAPNNEMAQHFYRRYGFYKAGEHLGSCGSVDLLEKYIGYKDLRE